MKTYLMLLLALPLYVTAQPTVTMNEFYNTGETIPLENCTPDTAGSAGANRLWDFSSVSSQSSLIISVTANTNPTPFGDADIIEVYPDGTKQYIRETNTDSYLDGYTNGTTGDTTSYQDDALHLDVYPFTYGSTLADSFHSFTSSTYGTGHVHLIGDGYGTLITPVNTYTNVLRIKRTITEADTSFTNHGDYTATNTTSYLWFDINHAMPLLRIDSIYAITGFNVKVQYYNSASSVNNISNDKKGLYTGAFNDNELIVNGNFEQGTLYELVLYDITGQKIYETQFTANGKQEYFDMNRQLSPAMYLVNLEEKNNSGSRNVIKVVKQ